ncbi:MAG TPA: hypothetical protein VJR94_11340 [Candidatus Nitrosocosmicus sp.]|nr:hypothetical protein [Candidatus Nitrosocosmicus sp.]
MVNYCLVVPLLPGKIELSRKFVEENGNHNKEHDEFYRIAGVTREQVWIQRSPPNSGAPDIQIVSLETEDPASTLKAFSTSSHPWAVRFRKFALEAFGIDFAAGPPPPLNELLVNWQVNE